VTAAAPLSDAAAWQATAKAAAGRLRRLTDDQRRRATCLTIWCGGPGNCRMGTVYNLAEGHLLALTGEHRGRPTDPADFSPMNDWTKNDVAILEMSGRGASVWSSTNCRCSKKDDTPIGFDLLLKAIANGDRRLVVGCVTESDSP